MVTDIDIHPEEITEPLIKLPPPVKKLYFNIIKKAWEGYDPSKPIREIVDISAMVSTNHVFRITFEDDDIIIAKLSYFGTYEFFKEDHRIIHTLSNNLLYPFENLLAKSLLKNNRVYIYRYKQGKTDAWVVFYNPTRILERMPRRLDEYHIRKFGQQIGKFHKACSRVKKCIAKIVKNTANRYLRFAATTGNKRKKFRIGNAGRFFKIPL